MEYFDICDEKGLPTGQTIERSEAHRLGIRHRTAHVWILQKTEDGWQVLLQKRSRNKDSFPGCLDTSSAGHIPAGYEPVESALRELEEELGIRAEAEELTFIGQFRIAYEKEFHGSLFRDNEISNVFVYSKPLDIRDIRIQEEELESVGWYGLTETMEACHTGNPAFCVTPESLGLLAEYVKTL